MAFQFFITSCYPLGYHISSYISNHIPYPVPCQAGLSQGQEKNVSSNLIRNKFLFPIYLAYLIVIDRNILLRKKNKILSFMNYLIHGLNKILKSFLFMKKVSKRIDYTKSDQLIKYINFSLEVTLVKMRTFQHSLVYLLMIILILYFSHRFTLISWNVFTTKNIQRRELSIKTENWQLLCLIWRQKIQSRHLFVKMWC